MENYRVYYTEAENNYNYNGEWYSEDVDADTTEEAIELVKAYITENGGNATDYIYKTSEFDIKYIVLHGAYDNEHPEDHFYNRKSKKEVYNSLQDALSMQDATTAQKYGVSVSTRIPGILPDGKKPRLKKRT